MIVVTGSNGFIGGALVRRLKHLKMPYLGVDFHKNPSTIHPDEFQRWWGNNFWKVRCVVHLGANTDTKETDWSKIEKENLQYSKMMWFSCVSENIPIIYASSAATYGRGEQGYSDDHSIIPKLKPLNLYGKSKNDFDLFTIDQDTCPHFWAGLKFFNVYGSNESHKGEMASMVYHGYHQIKELGYMKLFKYGHQIRDFIYVEDVVDVILWMVKNQPKCGIYNVGTGVGRSFNELANAIFDAMETYPHITYIEMPEELKDQYQTFTQANITKLRSVGYEEIFTPIEAGVERYVQILNSI